MPTTAAFKDVVPDNLEVLLLELLFAFWASIPNHHILRIEAMSVFVFHSIERISWITVSISGK